MVSKILIAVGSLLAHVVTASFEVYAYGQTEDVAIAGQRVFYADGVAYVGDRSPTNMTAVANISFSLVDEDTSKATYSLMIESANDTDTNIDISMDGSMFAINATSGADDDVRFINGSETGWTTGGFRMYGRNIMYEDADGNLQSNFYLLPASEENVWTLRWTYDPDSSNNETSVPVALRDIASSS